MSKRHLSGKRAPVNSSRWFARWPSAEELRANAGAEPKPPADEPGEQGGGGQVAMEQVRQSGTLTPEHVPDAQNRERFVEMGRLSGEARRAEKARAPREVVQEAVERLIVDDADAVARALLKSPAGVDRLLQLGAGIIAERKPEPTVIVLQSAFAAVRPPEKLDDWLRLLDEGDLTQLREELRVHAERPPSL